MMYSLITSLAGHPDLEVHVFGPDSYTADGASGPSGGDKVVDVLRFTVHRWHEVENTRKVW